MVAFIASGIVGSGFKPAPAGVENFTCRYNHYLCRIPSSQSETGVGASKRLNFKRVMIIILLMRDQFEELEASELFCPKCRRSQPVRKRLLLTLPDGDKYDYICAVCGEQVGGKMDQKDDNFRLLIK